MSKKVLTAEDILNETDSDEDSDSSSKSSEKNQVISQKTQNNNNTPTQPVQTQKETNQNEMTTKLNEEKNNLPVSNQEEVKTPPNTDERPEVDDRFGNILTSKSASAIITQSHRFNSNSDGQVNLDGVNNGSSDQFLKDNQEEDDEPNFNQRRQSYRATTQSVTYKSFTAGDKKADDGKQESQFLNSPVANLLSSPMGKLSKGFTEQDQSQEIDDAKLLRMIEQESSNEDDSQNDGASIQDKEVKSNNSIVSEDDILNRSLQSEGADDALDPTNFLRYASEDLNRKFDLLDIVDRNERQFKQVAEKMMHQSSQLISGDSDQSQAQQRRLTHNKVFEKIGEKFYSDNKSNNNIASLSITSLEEYIAVGNLDGSISLYDSMEQELKVLTDKSIKGNQISSIDMKRLDSNQNIFIICGHFKGHISLYEVKGLIQQWETPQQPQQRQPQMGIAGRMSGQLNIDTRGTNVDIEYKHRKTLDDVHQNAIVSIKFVGDFLKEIQAISCDITGLICITTFTDGMFLFRSSSKVLYKGRLGPTYSISPLVNMSDGWKVQNIVGLIEGGIKSQDFKERMVKQLKEITEKKNESEEQQEKPQLTAFGSLDEVYCCQFTPKLVPLLSIKRPAYIKQGSVPYLDWGLALTPTFRDQAYPVLAIAWGSSIQLAVYSNQKQVNQGYESPKLQLDGFYICEYESIDSVFFMSESLILIIVNKKEVKILYTQNFTPGVFDDQFYSKQLTQRKIGSQTNSEEDRLSIAKFQEIRQKYAGQVSSYAEKDSGYKMVDDEICSNDYKEYYNMTSEQGPVCNFNQTICKNFGFNVTAFSKTQIVQRNLIHWEVYLYLIRRTSSDFLKVLKAALDIFNGKMIGLAGLPDQKEKREQLMRERMKDLLKQNINACIKEFKEGQSVSQKTLRVATEFCIRIGAIDHLFGELFQKFQDSNVEQLFFENLDAFILSGKLKTVKIPHKILDNLIKFYRKKDVQLLEQALLNLELTKYPGSEEVRFICEEEQLSSALIHVLTTMFQDEKESDSTTCLSILCSLFSIMTRAKHKKTQKDVQNLIQYLDRFKTSVFELSVEDSLKIEQENKQEVFNQERSAKIEIEHSSTYIGYKILWILTMFLEGKKFPQGNLSSLRWRYYVMDIVRFCTNERFMVWFLEFDPDSFFAVLKKIFNDHEPYEFITTQDSFIQKHMEENPFLTPCYDHESIIGIFQRKVGQIIQSEKASNDGKNTIKAEILQNSFLFFLTQISRNKKITIAKPLCLKIVREQISFHKTLFHIPKKDLFDILPENQVARKDKDKTQNIYTYLIKKNEKDIIQILKRHQDTLQSEEIQSLLEDAKSSPLFKLKIFLFQSQGDFQKCLTLFFQIKAIKTDVFSWLYEIYHTLSNQSSQQLLIQTDQTTSEEINTEDDSSFFDVRGVGSRITFNKMKDLIKKNIIDFVTMDASKTVKLCDQWFEEDYMLIADELLEQKEIAFSFLSQVLTHHEQKILNEYNISVLQNKQIDQISKKYKSVLIRMIEILAERKIKNSNKILVDFVQRNYFPIDECLAICEKKGITEACAALYRRKGSYQKSIKLYMSTIVNLCVEKLIHTIFVEKNIKFEDPLCSNEHMQSFDSLVQQIIRICSKYGARQTEKEMEDLWMFSIKSLFEVKNEVFKKKREMEEPDSESDSSADRERHEEEMYFEKFVLIRNQYFLTKMSEHVKLRSIIQFLEQCGHAMKYDDFRRTFENKIQTELYFISILDSAIGLVVKEVKEYCVDILKDYSRGFKTKSKCDSCNQNLVNKFDKQEIWVMSCQHSFHARCVAKSEGTCTVCFNEIDVLYSFQQLRKEKALPGRNFPQANNQNNGDSNSSTTGSSRSSSEINNQSNDVNSIKKQREEDLKRSINQANKQVYVKRRVETRDEKFNRLMNEHEVSLKKNYLVKSDFILN